MVQPTSVRRYVELKVPLTSGPASADGTKVSFSLRSSQQ